MKRLGWFCYSVLRLIQNSKTNPDRFKTTQEYKDSKGSGTTVVGGKGEGVERFSVSEANREGVHRSACDFFRFHFFFSLFFNCFTLSYAFLPD